MEFLSYGHDANAVFNTTPAVLLLVLGITVKLKDYAIICCLSGCIGMNANL